MQERIYTYDGEEITVTWDLKRCIHAEECVHGLNEVFDKDKRPWIQPDNASAEDVADVIERCPTGALHYQMKQNDRTEKPSSKNRITFRENGPVYFFGDIEVQDADGNILLEETRFAMCRCGSSGNKPACDNSHLEKEWSAGVDPDTSNLEPTEQEKQQKLTIKLTKNGPAILKGTYTLESSNTGEFTSNRNIALCRCGGSSNKPFCDGTHRKNGFEG